MNIPDTEVNDIADEFDYLLLQEAGIIAKPPKPKNLAPDPSGNFWFTFVDNKISKQQEKVFIWGIYPDTAYSPTSGRFYRFNPDGTVKRMIFPYDNGMIALKHWKQGEYKLTHKNSAILAWEIMNCKLLPKGHIIYYKDLQHDNLCANNLGLISRGEYMRLRDCIANISGTLTIKTNGMYKYQVRYREDNKIKVKTFCDEEIAKNFKNIILQDSITLLGKYHVSKN